MFVTTSDFNVLPYKLPSMSTGGAEEFADFVESEEEVFLREVLGDVFYDAFIVGLNALPGVWDSTVPTVVNQNYVYGNSIWKALTIQTGIAPISGINWSLVENNNRWLLLKNGTTYLVNGYSNKWIGMLQTLKALIYSRWTEYNIFQQTVNGTVTPKTENNMTFDPSGLICRSWNDWSEKIGGYCDQDDSLFGYLYSSGSIYVDSIGTFTSMINYLDYEFNEQQTKNTFGI